MAYIDSYNLSQNSIFQGKVAIAIATASSQIYGESTSGDNDLDQKRAALSFAVLRDPVAWKNIFSVAVCTNPVITDSSSDSDIQFTVNSLWNDIAGA